MKKLFKQFIWFQSITINNQITILGWFLFIWQIKLDYTSIIDGINGIFPYANYTDNVEFFCVCGFYTFALFCTLICRVFNFGIWAIYFICWCYVVWHLPLDLITPDLWRTKHWYGFLDVLYTQHSAYFISMGLKVAEQYLIDFYNKVIIKWLKIK
jgi:hypothetical protein